MITAEPGAGTPGGDHGHHEAANLHGDGPPVRELSLRDLMVRLSALQDQLNAPGPLSDDAESEPQHRARLRWQEQEIIREVRRRRSQPGRREGHPGSQ